jgi:hypothetical protein
MFGGAHVAPFATRPGWIALGLTAGRRPCRAGAQRHPVSLILLLLAVILMVRRRPRFVLLLLAVATLGGVSLTLDARWSRFAESAAIGWNSPSRYWLTPDPALQPTTPSGAHPRGVRLHACRLGTPGRDLAIAEQPLGLGFGRDAFGRAIEMKYGYKGMVSSHSGWLDFALGSGLPGLACCC